MGILKKILKSQFIEMIEWPNDDLNKMVYRFPVEGNEIEMGAQVIVRESQIAVFVNEGKFELNTDNMPILQS